LANRSAGNISLLLSWHFLKERKAEVQTQ
jgi:hypothetical protein